MRFFLCSEVASLLAAVLLVACGPGASGDRAWERGDQAGAIEHYRAVEQLEHPRRLRLARALAGRGELNDAAVELEPVAVLEDLPPNEGLCFGVLAHARDNGVGVPGQDDATEIEYDVQYDLLI